jgi:hypothetical protein
VAQVADSVAKQVLNYNRSHAGWHSTKSSKTRTA